MTSTVVPRSLVNHVTTPSIERGMPAVPVSHLAPTALSASWIRRDIHGSADRQDPSLPDLGQGDLQHIRVAVQTRVSVNVHVSTRPEGSLLALVCRPS
jgi:hypothetical protein